MKRYILIHYGEIGLKKGNLEYFVEKLRKRVKLLLEQEFRVNFSVKHTLGRLMLLLPEDFDEVRYVSVIEKIFGIKNFKFVYEGVLDLKKLGEEIWNNLPKNEAGSFRVKVKRSMLLPFRSPDAERELGADLLQRGIDKKVKMHDPDLMVDVEFLNEHAYFSFKKYAGAGGMSPDSQGKFVSLLSSGIDSPVAAYKMMRRGARVIFAHFHGYPFTDKDEMEQVKDLVKILNNYQANVKLYLLPFGQFQKAVGTNLEIPGKMRTILYRRMMLRIAQEIAIKEGAMGLITGDSLGQVSSQTTENLLAIHDASSIPVYQPLISFDKEEIIEIAKRIGTYEISKLPCKDTCTMFMSRNPELRANVVETRKLEKYLAIDDWIEKVIAEAEVLSF